MSKRAWLVFILGFYERGSFPQASPVLRAQPVYFFFRARPVYLFSLVFILNYGDSGEDGKNVKASMARLSRYFAVVILMFSFYA